ncbi:condensation domain-containing protein [Actinokineospora sp. NBRC 105648]|uniref:condensation domain-containing protein n=1 Tax=Actinokineospora sp. NBRC 105648 TaxID=3032206 RepID=UPI0024A1533A|nr:condensation domain-containing protein [Actinokineospora sp. NBRC 105648]GLZ39702.1 peptide synthetase [Actinokineospora sp. NBRC 105648]
MSRVRAGAPVSFAQERLWLVDQAAPGSAVYAVPLLVRWRGRVDPVALGVALTAVLARHEVLRTTYHLDGDQPVQRVREPAPVPVEVVTDLSDVDAGIAARSRMPFDLAAGPVLRATAWVGVAGGDLVLITVHHIAIDGWSLAVLQADLAEAYAAAVVGRSPELPELPLQYKDFAAQDRADFDARACAARAAVLADEPGGLLLAGGRAGETAPEGSRPGRQQAFPIPAPLWAGVLGLARELRATPFVVLSAALQAVVARWSGRSGFVLGAVTANRARPEVEDLVGFFVNTVPLRCQVDLSQGFRQLCAAARAEGYRSLTYQGIPFDRLTSAVAAIRPEGHGRLVEVCFALQNWPARVAERWEPPRVLDTGTAKFDLLLMVEETPDGVIGTVEYDTDRYPESVCAGVIVDYLVVLAAVVADPDRPLDSLELTALPGRAAPVRRAPVDRPVAAERVPDAVALFTEALAGLGRAVTPQSNFFALGGHSLLAVTMLAAAGRRHGVAVSPRDFLADPTVPGLAALLAAAPRRPKSTVDTEASEWRASSAQQRFWFLDRIPTLRSAYLLPTVLELPADTDTTALKATVDRVLAHHPALRSRFRLDRKQRAVTYRTDGDPAASTLTDARDWLPELLRDHVAALCWTPVDLAAGPPARAEIITAPGRVLLVLVAHHIVADGWSRGLLLRHILGGDVPEVVHPSAVRDESTDAAELIEWLRGAPVDVDLPHDRPRPEVQETLADRVSASVSLAPLRAAAEEFACGMFLLTAALLAVTLARRGDHRDFLFAFPWSAREDDTPVVAMQVNTLVVRVDLRGEPTWRELLARVRESGAISYRHADASYDAVVAALHPDRGLSRPPLTPVYLAVDDSAPPPAGTLLPLDPLHVKYELELTAAERGDRLVLDLAYAVGLFDRDTAESLLRALVATAAGLGPDLDNKPLSDLNPLSTKETVG